MPIREATVDDAAAIRRVASAAWHAAHGPILGAEAVDDLLDRWYDLADRRESIADERGTTLVATVDGAVVGFASGGPSDDDRADAVVRAIYVHPDRWGEGHGSALLERLFDGFRAAGHESVWLAVLADNDIARSFYDAHGFAVREERDVELAGVETRDVVLGRGL